MTTVHTKLFILFIGFIIFITIAFVAFSVWWWFFHKKTSGGALQCKATQKGTMCLTNGFIAAIEQSSDDSMPTPTGSVKLLNFDANSEFPPWCIPSFYAIRYVDTEGNYGDLSSWFGPVVSQPTATPGGCGANLPNLIAEDLQDPNINKYYINVHRQDSSLDTTSAGRVVGMLSPVVYEFLDDPNSNPNISGNAPCNTYGC